MNTRPIFLSLIFVSGVLVLSSVGQETNAPPAGAENPSAASSQESSPAKSEAPPATPEASAATNAPATSAEATSTITIPAETPPTNVVEKASAMTPKGYPPPTDKYVNDFANVISAGDKESIRQLFKNVDQQTRIEAMVATINTLQDWNTGEKTIDSLATHLFNEWGIGKKEVNNGLLILVAVKDHQWRFKPGTGFSKEQGAMGAEAIEKAMTPFFKKEQYSAGLLAGAQAMIGRLTTKAPWYQHYLWPMILGVLIMACIAAGISCMMTGKKGWGWVFFIGGGLLIMWLVRMIFKEASSKLGGGKSEEGSGGGGSW